MRDLFLFQTSKKKNYNINYWFHLHTFYILYTTLFENNGWIEKELIALTAPQVNLLSDLTYYNMMNNKIINGNFMEMFK